MKLTTINEIPILQFENVKQVVSGKRARSESPREVEAAEAAASQTPPSRRSRSPASSRSRRSQTHSSGSSRSRSSSSYSSSEEEEEEEEIWLRALFDPVAPPSSSSSAAAAAAPAHPPGTQIACDEIFWLFTQFGVVSKVMYLNRNHFFVQMTRGKDSIAYFRAKTVQFENGHFQLKIHPQHSEPNHGTLREYSGVNRGLRELLLNVNSEDAADGLDAFFEHNKWAKRSFVWSRWVAGDGWLEPKQDDSLCRQMPPRVKTDERFVHIGSLWDTATSEQIFRLASLYGSVDLVSPQRKTPTSIFCIVKFNDKEAARLFMKHLHGVMVLGRKLRVDCCTEDVSRYSKGTRLRERMRKPTAPAPTQAVLVPGLSTENFSAFARYARVHQQMIRVTKKSARQAEDRERQWREYKRREADHERRGRRNSRNDRRRERSPPPVTCDHVVAFDTVGEALVFLSANNLQNYRGTCLQLSFFDIQANESLLGDIAQVAHHSDRPDSRKDVKRPEKANIAPTADPRDRQPQRLGGQRERDDTRKEHGDRKEAARFPRGGRAEKSDDKDRDAPQAEEGPVEVEKPAEDGGTV